MTSLIQILNHIFLMEIVFLMGWSATMGIPSNEDRLLIIAGAEALYLIYFIVAKKRGNQQ